MFLIVIDFSNSIVLSPDAVSYEHEFSRVVNELQIVQVPYKSPIHGIFSKGLCESRRTR